MSYIKHEYKSGDKLYASDLNEMDEQIALNETNIGQLEQEIASYSNVSYGTCSTVAATAEKVVTVDNENWELKVGAVVMVKFTTSNSASNVKLNVNETGAYPIWYNNAEYTSTGTAYTGYANRVIGYMFNGTHWVWIMQSYDANTTYKNVALGHGYATCTTAEATAAKVGTLSSYTLTVGGIVAVKFTYGVPASATLNINSKGAKAIYFRGAAITAGIIKAGDTATFIYNGSQYHLLSIDRWQNDIVGKADKATTLAGYGITDGATKQEVTQLQNQIGDQQTEINERATTVYVDSEINSLKAQGVQQTPLFANSLDECTDTTKMYVLPDGYIYAYMLSDEPVQTNLFSFEDADANFSRISGSSDTGIYNTNANYGVKDTANSQFISKKTSSDGRFVVTGGLPPALPAGEYKVSADVLVPSGTTHLAVRFGASSVPSNVNQYVKYTIASYDTWTTVEHKFTVAEGDRYTYVALMSETVDSILYWKNIKVVSAKDEGTLKHAWLNTGFLFVPTVKQWHGKKWATVGDSITADTSVTSKHYYTYISEETGISVVNMGNSASGFKREFDIGTAYYQRILDVPTDADVVTIMASGNDLSSTWETYGLGENTDTGTDTICGCINTTLDNLYSIMPTVNVGIITPTPWDSFYPSATADPQNRMTLYSEAIIEICKRRSIPCLDLYHCSGLRPWDAQFRNLAYSKDNGGGTHPDETGHAIIAPKIKAFLETLLM